jgi:hypothetical protein
MTERTFTGKTGDVWTWDETPEVVEALKKVHAGDYQGPLYAPHPDLKRPNEYKTTDN